MTESLQQRALNGKPFNDFPVIDFHVHLGRWGLMDIALSDREMLPKMDRVGINRICVNGIFFPYTKYGNNTVAEFIGQYPDRAIGVASLNPFQDNIVDELKRCVEELGFRAIKLHTLVSIGNGQHPMPDPRLISNQWEQVFTLAANHHLPILYHGVVTEDDIQNFPETIFIMAHGLYGLKGIKNKQRYALYRNLYLDTCHTQTTVWEAEETMRIFSPDRIVWGSDAPLDDFAQRLGIVMNLSVSDEDKKKIIGGNAIRLLKLEL